MKALRQQSSFWTSMFWSMNNADPRQYRHIPVFKTHIIASVMRGPTAAPAPRTDASGYHIDAVRLNYPAQGVRGKSSLMDDKVSSKHNS